MERERERERERETFVRPRISEIVDRAGQRDLIQGEGSGFMVQGFDVRF